MILENSSSLSFTDTHASEDRSGGLHISSRWADDQQHAIFQTAYLHGFEYVQLGNEIRLPATSDAWKLLPSGLFIANLGQPIHEEFSADHSTLT